MEYKEDKELTKSFIKFINRANEQFPDNCMGRKTIYPICAFSDKGYNWSIRFNLIHVPTHFLVSKKKSITIDIPSFEKIECQKGLPVTIWDEEKEEYVLCDCNDCVKGRALVKKGWQPDWYKIFKEQVMK